MRFALFALLLAVGLGCTSTPDPAIQTAIQGNLQDLQRLEAAILDYIPADAEPVDFSTFGGDYAGETLYRPRDGFRLILRGAQLRAASLVAWSQNEKFDQAAGVEALIIPAILEAKKNLPKPDDE